MSKAAKVAKAEVADKEPQPLDEKINDLIKEVATLAIAAPVGEMKALLRIQRETLVALKGIIMFTETALDEIQDEQGTQFDRDTGTWMKTWVDQAVEAFEAVIGSLPPGEAHNLYATMIKDGKEISQFIADAMPEEGEEDEDDDGEEEDS